MILKAVAVPESRLGEVVADTHSSAKLKERWFVPECLDGVHIAAVGALQSLSHSSMKRYRRTISDQIQDW